MTSSPVPAVSGHRRRELLPGAVLAALACLGLPWLADALGTRFALTPAVPAALVLGVGLALRRDARTRAWGSGLLLGLGLAVAVALAGLVVLLRVFAG